MNTPFTPRKARAVARFLCATALLSTPVFAQDAAPQTAPASAAPQAAPAQPVIVTPPKSATVDIPPVVSTVSDAQAAPAAATPDTDEAKPAPRAATRSARTHVTRSVTRTTTARAAPVAAPVAAAPAEAPAAAPAPQPAAPAPEAAVPQPAAPVADTQTVTTNTPATSSTTRTSSDVMGLPLWAWIAGGVVALIIVLAGIFAATRRKSHDYDYDEATTTNYVEPLAAEPMAEPVAVPVAEMDALPIAKPEPRKEPEYLRRRASVESADSLETVVAAPDEVQVEKAPADEVAELTAGTAPVAERPWLEFAMRPVRAGTNIDEALVEIELTVGNSGSVAATDVRISTYLLSADPSGTEVEKMLLNPPADSTTDPVTIKPGEGKRIDATLALLKSQMGEDLPASFRPVVVADARYTMPDGSEGRTSASFVIGVTPEEGTGLDPIELNRASMHENVGAELNGEPQHA